MRAARLWVVCLLLISGISTAGGALAQAPSDVQAPWPWSAASEGANAAPSCPGLSRLLNSSRLLQSVDLISVRRFYDAHGVDCAWSPDNAAQMLGVIAGAGDHGLDPNLFHALQIKGLEGNTESMAVMTRDVLLTDAAIRYARFMSEGIGPVAEGNLDAPADRLTQTDRLGALGASLQDGAVGQWLAGLAPRYSGYSLLQQGLVRYRGIVATGGWELLPASLWRPGQKDFSALRRRLHAEGDLAADDGSPAFDAELRAGLARFQWRNGLTANGALSPETIRRLNVSASERVASLALNLERLRRTLPDLPVTRVEVNLPAATAVLYRDGRRVLRMNAVIGKPEHETPELSSVIDSIVLNPPWTIPTSIVENEIKPALRRDPKYLVKNKMSWQNGLLVQAPGSWNALGRIKFDFPNPYAVYLHDTPARALFADPERAESHGCVRLERPVDLAEALLKSDPTWDLQALNAAIASGRTQRIRLGEPMPVVLSYQTAFAEADGSIHFRSDVYGRDTRLTVALSSRLGPMDPAASP